MKKLIFLCFLIACSSKPQPTPIKQDFDWSKVKKYGGPEISLASDVGGWAVTSQLRSVKFSGDMIIQDRDVFTPKPCVGIDHGSQGNFNACVKQDDGKYICGSWDWEKCGGQAGGKTLGNFAGASPLLTSFGLKKGSEICFFNSGLARDAQRNEKIRTSVFCTTWNR